MVIEYKISVKAIKNSDFSEKTDRLSGAVN